MRRVVLTALAALALVAFTFSGCKKQPPVTPDKTAPTQGKAETKAPAGQPTTAAPAKPAPAPADKQAAPAPAPAPTTPAPTDKPAGSK